MHISNSVIYAYAQQCHMNTIYAYFTSLNSTGDIALNLVKVFCWLVAEFFWFVSFWFWGVSAGFVCLFVLFLILFSYCAKNKVYT